MPQACDKHSYFPKISVSYLFKFVTCIIQLLYFTLFVFLRSHIFILLHPFFWWRMTVRNSFKKTSVVSLSMLHILTFSIFPQSPLLSQAIVYRIIIFAHNFIGKPLTPKEMAGIETLLTSKALAVSKMFKTVLYKSSMLKGFSYFSYSGPTAWIMYYIWL